MAKYKTVLQTLGFAYGEREVTFASQRSGEGLKLFHEVYTRGVYLLNYDRIRDKFEDLLCFTCR